MGLQKEKEELDDITSELELADEDETVPYVYNTSPYCLLPYLSDDSSLVTRSATPSFMSKSAKRKRCSPWRQLRWKAG
jgi:hypothetical protein